MKMLLEKSTRDSMSWLDEIWYSVNTVMGKNLRIRKAGEIFTVREHIVEAV